MEKEEIQLNRSIKNLKINTNSANILIRKDNVNEPVLLINGNFDVKNEECVVEVKEKNNYKSNFSHNFNSIIKIGNITINGNMCGNIYNSGNNTIIIGNCNNSYNNHSIEIVIPNNFRKLDLNIDTKSGNVKIEKLAINDLVVDTMSGNVSLYDVDIISGDLDTMSGNVSVEVYGSMDSYKLHLDTMSGKISKSIIEDSSFEPITNASINLEHHNLRIDTMSGNINMLFKSKKRSFNNL